MPFVVPAQYLRNSPGALAAEPPADTGRHLLDYLARRLGRQDLAGVDVLDMGCGTRFTDTLINRPVAIGSYTGIDVDRGMVDFLVREANDPRLSHHHLSAYHEAYNPGGERLHADRVLPIGDARFDVITLYSVFTHMVPEDIRAMLTILRRHVRPDGRLFFTAGIDDTSRHDYYEKFPAQPTLASRYTSAYLRRVCAATGWSVLSQAKAYDEDLPMLDSFLCAPA